MAQGGTARYKLGLDILALWCYAVVGARCDRGFKNMELKLYYSTVIKPFDDSRNDGFDAVFALLKQIEDKGIKCHRVDTSQLTDEQIAEAYIHSVIGPTQLKKYRVRQVFGSARHSGWLFGRQVPALVVYTTSSQMPEDVFPHAIGGRIVTINEYLEKLTQSLR